jgi:hypothetical protein
MDCYILILFEFLALSSSRGFLLSSKSTDNTGTLYLRLTLSFLFVASITGLISSGGELSVPSNRVFLILGVDGSGLGRPDFVLV